jgi:hypothetical protein
VSAEVFEGYRDLHRATLRDLGTDALDLADVAEFLKAQAAAERAEGDHLVLESVTADGICTVGIRRGYYKSHDLEGLSPPEMARLVAARSNTLARVHKSARDIAEGTGVRPAEAVCFLLTGITPMLPWVRVTTDRHGRRGDKSDRVTFTIVVGSPDVPLDDVRKAYKRARERAMSEFPTRTTKQRPARTRTLLEFVANRPDMTWAERYAAWEQEHGEVWHYSETDVFRRSWDAASKRFDDRVERGSK